MLDIHTVGAGGGSIARVDAGGALRVGPESAGADPGPICYGRGGRDVTVTDAHVWLGRIPTDAFRAGDRQLDRAAIEGPLRTLSSKLGVTPEEAAAGVLEVATGSSRWSGGSTRRIWPWSRSEARERSTRRSCPAGSGVRRR